jgi:uncharacterized membrane protein
MPVSTLGPSVGRRMNGMSNDDRTNMLYTAISWLLVLVIVVAYWKGLWSF